MIKFSADAWSIPTDPGYVSWKKIDEIIQPYYKGSEYWNQYGYEGISKITEEKFGISVTRDNKSVVTYTFKRDEDYIAFKLKYL